MGKVEMSGKLCRSTCRKGRSGRRRGGLIAVGPIYMIRAKHEEEVEEEDGERKREGEDVQEEKEDTLVLSVCRESKTNLKGKRSVCGVVVIPPDGTFWSSLLRTAT